MIFTFEFTDGNLQTYECVEEIHKDGKVYKLPFKDMPVLFSGEYTFIHSDGRKSIINGNKVKTLYLG